MEQIIPEIVGADCLRDTAMTIFRIEKMKSAGVLMKSIKNF